MGGQIYCNEKTLKKNKTEKIEEVLRAFLKEIISQSNNLNHMILVFKNKFKLNKISNKVEDCCRI